MENILKNTIKTSIINYIGIIIGVVSVLFIQTEILTEKEIGIIRLILDKSLLILPFFLFGISSVASRFYFYFENDENFYNGFITFLLGIPLVTLTTGYIISKLFNLSQNIANFQLLIYVLFFSLYILIFESHLSTKAKIIYPSFLRNILFRVIFLLILGLYYYEIIDYNKLLIFYTGIYFIHFSLLLIYFLKNLNYRFSINFSLFKHPAIKEIIPYSLFLFLGAGSGVLVTKIDTVMIEEITKSQAYVGIYTIALAIASFIEVPRRPILKLSLPILAKKIKEDKMDDVLSIYRKTAINLLIIGSIIFILIWFNLDLIFHLIPNGSIYAHGKYIVFFIGLAKLVDLAVGVNSEIILSSKYYKWNIFLMPFLGVISILLNYLLIKQFGYTGAAIATLFSFVLFNFFRTILVLVKLNLSPFTLNYLKVLPLMFLTFLLNYFFKTDSLFLNSLLSITLVLLFFVLPIYKFRLSADFNKIINAILNKTLRTKY